MGIQLKNNASGTLATAINASDTGIVLTTGNGASFPALGASDYFYATLESTGGTFEVIKVTVRSGDSMTVVRAQEGSTANSFAAGSRIELRVTAQSVLDVVDQVTAAQVEFTPVGALTATNVQAAITEVVTDLALSSGSSTVGFLQVGSGAVATTAQAKLRQIVNILDFGADPTGVADSAPAINAALAQLGALSGGGELIIPSGTFLVNSQCRVPSNIRIRGQYNSIININPLNWTGGITKFYALFTTVNVTASPEVGYWRIGTGTLTYFNIQIENLTINLNRDGTVLTPTQMLNSAFNAVRFEDAQNCYVTNCRFIDSMTQANHNAYTMVVFFVRSQQCYVDGSAFEKTSCLFLAESRYCGFTNNTSIYGNSSPVESIAGQGHYIANNNFGVYWETTSCVGINSLQCVIEHNVFTAPMLMAVVLGHDQPSPPEPSQYGVSVAADNSIVRHNNITGIAATNFGIYLQNATNSQIDSNTIVNLGKGAAYNTDDKIAIRVSGAGAVTRFLNNTINNNTIDNATAGIRISDGDSITISDNYITDTKAAIYIAGSAGYETVISNNYISGAESAILSFNGNCRASNNKISNITANNPQFSIFMAYGSQQFSNNSISVIGECCMFNFTTAEIMNNVFTNSPAVAGDLWILNNDGGAGPAAGTATAYEINIAGNKNAAFTNFVHTYRVFDYGTTDFIQNMITTAPGSLVWNPANIASGSGETSPAISVIYSAFGYPVIVAAPYNLQGMTATAYVDGTNSVRIRVDNNTGGAIDLASGTWKIWVLKV